MNKTARKKLEADLTKNIVSYLEPINKQATAKSEKHIKKHARALSKKFATAIAKAAQKKAPKAKKVKK